MDFNTKFKVHFSKENLLKASNSKFKSGVSLVEILVGMAVGGIVLLLVASIYFTHFKVFSNQSTAIDVASQNKIGLSDLTNEIRQSQSITSTCSACGGDTTSATVIVLQIWPQDTNGDPKDPNPGYDYMVYKKNASGNLVRNVYPDSVSTRKAESNKVIATNVTNLQFAYNNADPTLATQVTIDFTTSKTTFGKALTTAEQSKAQLRNK